MRDIQDAGGLPGAGATEAGESAGAEPPEEAGAGVVVVVAGAGVVVVAAGAGLVVVGVGVGEVRSMVMGATEAGISLLGEGEAGEANTTGGSSLPVVEGLDGRSSLPVAAGEGESMVTGGSSLPVEVVGEDSSLPVLGVVVVGVPLLAGSSLPVVVVEGVSVTSLPVGVVDREASLPVVGVDCPETPSSVPVVVAPPSAVTLLASSPGSAGELGTASAGGLGAASAGAGLGLPLPSVLLKLLLRRRSSMDWAPAATNDPIKAQRVRAKGLRRQGAAAARGAKRPASCAPAIMTAPPTPRCWPICTKN